MTGDRHGGFVYANGTARDFVDALVLVILIVLDLRGPQGRGYRTEGETEFRGWAPRVGTPAATPGKILQKMCKILFDGVSERNMLLSR